MDGLNLGLSDVSRTVRLSLLLVIAATSELAFIAVEVSVTKNLIVLYRGMWLSCAVLVAVAICIAWLHQPARRQLGSFLAILVTFAGTVIAAISPIGGGMAFVLAVVCLAAVWRGRHLYAGKIVPLSHFHFAVDTVAFVTFGGYLGLSLLSQTLLLAPFATGPFVLIQVCALAGWLYTLWSIERSATFSHGASRGGLVVMLILAAFVGLFGLRILKATAFAIFAVFGFALIPLVQKPLNIGITKQEWNRAMGHTKQAASTRQWKAPPPLLHGQTLHLIAIGLGIAALAALLVVLRRVRPTYASKSELETAPIEVVHRRPLTDASDPFLMTQDPVRLRVQQWLREQLSKGQRWSGGRTVRALVEESGQASDVKGILEQYETVRYGRTTDK